LLHISYACAGIEVEGSIVCKAAPIFGWMVGKSLGEVKTWVEKKKGTIVKVEIKKSKLF